MPWNWILAAGAMGVALSQEIILLWYATVSFNDEQQHPSDLPFGYVAALILYLEVGSSLLAAGVSFLQLTESPAEIDEKLLWLGTALIIAPWYGTLLSFTGILGGPIGLLLTAGAGSAVPILVAYLKLREPRY